MASKVSADEGQVNYRPVQSLIKFSNEHGSFGRERLMILIEERATIGECKVRNNGQIGIKLLPALRVDFT